jgi:hypothetical protein
MDWMIKDVLGVKQTLRQKPTSCHEMRKQQSAGLFVSTDGQGIPGAGLTS